MASRDHAPSDGGVREPAEAPAFEPFMLRGLTYVQAVQSMKATGCAIRRNHWCAPVVVWLNGRVMLDDDGEISPFTLDSSDRRAQDWEMVPAPEAEAASPAERQGQVPGTDTK